jgi:hypothetical protein
MSVLATHCTRSLLPSTTSYASSVKPVGSNASGNDNPVAGFNDSTTMA